MTFAFHLGLSLSEYEEYTPKQLNMLGEAFASREKHKMEAEITYAWMNAYYQRVENLKPLKECLDEAFKTPEEKVMTDEAMLEMVKMLNARYGGTVEEGKESSNEGGE